MLLQFTEITATNSVVLHKQNSDLITDHLHEMTRSSLISKKPSLFPNCTNSYLAVSYSFIWRRSHQRCIHLLKIHRYISHLQMHNDECFSSQSAFHFVRKHNINEKKSLLAFLKCVYHRVFARCRINVIM